mmetsp:Transcript_63153/g.124848  ORF Transcript_63153/g.124848 Transcript_63153/m.124848 type:complete len:218 (-) Transcript_63153:523-1176(-)
MLGAPVLVNAIRCDGGQAGLGRGRNLGISSGGVQPPGSVMWCGHTSTGTPLKYRWRLRVPKWQRRWRPRWRAGRRSGRRRGRRRRRRWRTRQRGRRGRVRWRRRRQAGRWRRWLWNSRRRSKAPLPREFAIEAENGVRGSKGGCIQSAGSWVGVWGVPRVSLSCVQAFVREARWESPRSVRVVRLGEDATGGGRGKASACELGRGVGGGRVKDSLLR